MKTDRGFALIALIFMMLIMAVMAIALNRRAGTRLRMAANESFGVERAAARDAALERGVWRLTLDPCYRTAVTGVVETFNGHTFLLRVLDVPDLYTNGPSGYSDAVVVDCRDADSNRLARATYRYRMDSFPLKGTPDIDKTGHIALDASGTLYIADPNRNRIRKVTPDGTMTTFAGTGDAGYSGNNGLATHARLNHPFGVAVAANGDVYIADTENHWIRKVAAQTGIITLYAGSYDKDGKPTSDLFNKPCGVCVARSGNVYVADTGNHRIRRITPYGTVSTFVGTGEGGYSGDGWLADAARLNRPCGVSIDPSQYYMYIADTDNHCIRMVSAWNGRICTVAGTGSSGDTGDGGPATSARLNKPYAVHADASRNLFVADRGNHVIRLVNGHNGIIRALAGTGSGGYDGDGRWAVESRLHSPTGIVMASSRGAREILIADGDNKRIRVLHLAVEPLIY